MDRPTHQNSLVLLVTPAGWENLELLSLQRLPWRLVNPHLQEACSLLPGPFGLDFCRTVGTEHVVGSQEVQQSSLATHISSSLGIFFFPFLTHRPSDMLRNGASRIRTRMGNSCKIRFPQCFPSYKEGIRIGCESALLTKKSKEAHLKCSCRGVQALLLQEEGADNLLRN